MLSEVEFSNAGPDTDLMGWFNKQASFSVEMAATALDAASKHLREYNQDDRPAEKEVVQGIALHGAQSRLEAHQQGVFDIGALDITSSLPIPAPRTVLFVPAGIRPAHQEKDLLLRVQRLDGGLADRSVGQGDLHRRGS